MNAFFQEAFGLVAHDAAEALEDDLQEDPAVAAVVGGGRGLVEFVVVDPVAADQAQLPAAAVVLEAAEGFQGTIAVVVILPASDGAPLRDHRPDDREVVLADLVIVLDEAWLAFHTEVAAADDPVTGELVVADGVVAVAVTGVDHLVRIVFRLVVEHRAAGAGAMGVRVPVEVGGQAPVAVETIQVLQGVGGH
ncbi:hypothetical protein D9M69_473460 [compost metagenome]